VHIDRAVAGPEEAQAVLGYFHDLHDSLIERLTLVCSGRVDLELLALLRKSADGQINEALCKVLCYDLCRCGWCTSLGIEPSF
jgi:hypothetical protein